MLELTVEQVAALAHIDSRNFVDNVRRDLVKERRAFADDHSLSDRLEKALRTARSFGINRDDNLVAFLRLEAYVPGFYQKPATRNWLTRSGRPGDERLHDYLCALRWNVAHPEMKGGIEHGGSGHTGFDSGNRGNRTGNKRWLGLAWPFRKRGSDESPG